MPKYYKKFPVSTFSPSLQKMCREPYDLPSYRDPSEPIDYIAQYSITDEDIPDLLKIAQWHGRETDMNGCMDAPLHAWEALSLLDPTKVIPGALEVLNTLDWDNLDGFHDEIYLTLGHAAERMPETIPLLLSAMQEDRRHEETRRVIHDAVYDATRQMPDYAQQFHEICVKQLEELRIDCRDWYASLVCDLTSSERMTPELVDLLRKACLGGLVNLCIASGNDNLREEVGLDFEGDPKLRPIYDEFRTISEILRDFENCGRTFPKQAVLDARKYRDRIIPSLIEAIRNATAYARFGVANRSRTVQFAVHLLAEFQAKEALPAIFDSLSLSIDEIWDHLYADGYFESMPGILNRLIGDEPEFYDQKLRDPQAPVALQCCLSRSLKYLVARNVVSEETYVDWMREYLEIAIQSKKKELVTDLVCDLVYASNPDDLPLLRSAFEKELVNEDRIPWEEVEIDIEEGTLTIVKMLPDPKRDFSDAIREMSGWAWFRENSLFSAPPPPQPKPASPTVIDVSDGPKVLNLSSLVPPSGRLPADDDDGEDIPVRKIGRNDPCPCGSGKKYKKCCMK